MIYYVVGIHRVSHNEHVVNSYSKLEAAIADKERYEVEAPAYDYRVDTILTSDEIAERNARITPKEALNRAFGRAKMDHEEGYPEGTKMFNMAELFGVEGLVAGECAECGASVANYAKHTEWHNKLLP